MTITHASAGTTAETLAITTTLPTDAWTLAIGDNSATTPGFMDRVDCTTKALLGGSLSRALHWSTALTNGDLSGSSATVTSGIGPLPSLVLNYRQSLASSDAVTSGDCYQVTVTLTLS